MVEVMKTRARNETYNVGYNQQIALYNEVATRLDDATLLGDFAFDGDKKYGITEDPEKEGTVAETWVVMDHLIERQNNWVCTAYPEYKTIPRRSECIIQEQRTTRSPKRGPIGLVSPLVKDSQVKTRASSSPKGVRKSSSSPKGIRKASSSPKRTRKASLSPKRIPKAPLLQRDAPIARRRVTRGTTLGLLSSKEPTDASPALRPAFARRRMSSSSTFSTIIVAPAKGYEA